METRANSALHESGRDELTETRLEERDGALWVSGLCPYCWERLAFPVPPPGESPEVRCSSGHRLRIVDRTSAGSRGPGG
jgi:hypothetical protein